MIVQVVLPRMCCAAASDNNLLAKSSPKKKQAKTDRKKRNPEHIDEKFDAIILPSYAYCHEKNDTSPKICY